MHSWFWYSLAAVAAAGLIWWAWRLLDDNAILLVDDDIAWMIEESLRRGEV
jgi:hypothetical protein